MTWHLGQAYCRSAVVTAAAEHAMHHTRPYSPHRCRHRACAAARMSSALADDSSAARAASAVHDRYVSAVGQLYSPGHGF